MIEPASLADWTLFATMAAVLGTYAVLGHRWVLAARPTASTPERSEPVMGRDERAA
jgi:hypothetical protein